MKSKTVDLAKLENAVKDVELLHGEISFVEKIVKAKLAKIKLLLQNIKNIEGVE